LRLQPASGTLAPGALRLVDTEGKVVGLFALDGILGAAVVLDTPGRRVAVPVQTTGIAGRFNDSFQWWYASMDCSGTPYMAAGQGSDLGTVADGTTSGVSAGKLVYSAPPWTRSQMNSFRRWKADEDPAWASGACFRESVTVGTWGHARVFDLTSFVPPFRVE
jgi:hypothetical protein